MGELLVLPSFLVYAAFEGAGGPNGGGCTISDVVSRWTGDYTKTSLHGQVDACHDLALTKLTPIRNAFF